MERRRVLIITYYWPPSGGVGVQRWLHFAKNLKLLGWEPIVYTPENPQFDIKDEGLVNMVGEIEVIKRPIWEPFTFFHKITGNKNKENVKQGLVLEKSKKTWKDDLIVWVRGNMFIPDPRVFWVRPSMRYLLKEVRRKEIGTIITTGPPHSMHLIGLALKNRIPDLKWLADFRDPWSDWDVLPKLRVTRLAMARHKKLERLVLRNCDQPVTVSYRLATSLAEKSSTKSEVKVLPNGISDDKAVLKQSVASEDQFIIGYFGMLNEIRDPEGLWSELEKLCDQNDEFAKKLSIRLGGIVAQSIQDRLLASPQLGSKVVFLEYLSHEEVFKEYYKSSVLLLLLNKSDNAKWILPMKFFEYLSAGKPILSLGTRESELGELFEGRKVGKMFEFEESAEIGNFILSNFEQRFELDKNDFEELLKGYSRSAQTRKLVEILENL